MLLTSLISYGQTNEESINIENEKAESKFDNPFIEDMTSCVCDYNDIYATKKKIHISKFVSVPSYKSNEGYLFVYDRKEILDYEKILLDSIHNLLQYRFAWSSYRSGFNKVKREFENIIKINNRKDSNLQSDVSSATLIKLLQPNQFRKGRDKVINIRKKLIDIYKNYSEAGVLLDCLVNKNYNKSDILSKEFFSSIFFWTGEKKLMDRYYKTRLTLSESIKFDTIGFYILRRLSSFFGYFIYLISIILIYRFIKLKITKP